MQNYIKICGITNIVDALISAELGATHLGLIFHPESKRYIDIKTAKNIIINIKSKYPNIKITGVFVNHNPKEINKYLDNLKLDSIQLHGEESRKYIEQSFRESINKNTNKNSSPQSLRAYGEANPCEVQSTKRDISLNKTPKIYVIDINPDNINSSYTNINLNLKNIKKLNPNTDLILFDLPKKNISDKNFKLKIKNINPNIINNIKQKFPEISKFNILLAGNISSNYLSDIIKNKNQINIGFDICSSVEKDSNPRKKSKQKLVEIFNMINNYSKNNLILPKDGYFGQFGGQYIPEILVPALKQLEEKSNELLENPGFIKQLDVILKQYAGRPTPLTPAENLADFLYPNKKDNIPKIYLKREDLLHTGAHKLNNALGQCLLAKYMNKTRIIAETGAGQHGVATATACAYLNLECVVYMGETDCARQQQNVARMKALGAEVSEVKAGQGTLKEAVNEAMRDYATNFENTNYCLGSALGPHPYPKLVAHFQKIIGEEVQVDCAKLNIKPNYLIAPVGGGSNAIGLFLPYLNDENIKMIGVEAGGSAKKPKEQPGKHAARFSGGSPGILHGCLSYLLQNQDGQILPTESISAGLDYPSVGPQHAYLHQQKRVNYFSVNDKSALNAFHILTKKEGIIPALESSHAIGYLIDNKHKFKKGDVIILNLSGRGDKDLEQVLNIKNRDK